MYNGYSVTFEFCQILIILLYCANSAVLYIDDVVHFAKFWIHGIYNMYVWVCGNFNCSLWVSKTGAGLLQQVKSRLNVSEAPQDEDSFSLFLCLLGKHLNSCLSQSHQRHWQQMKGRIYSKFSPNKLLALTEMGLYHFVSLFLTLAITVDLQEVVSPSHVYTELFYCGVSISNVFCMVTVMWNTLHEWIFLVWHYFWLYVRCFIVTVLFNGLNRQIWWDMGAWQPLV